MTTQHQPHHSSTHQDAEQAERQAAIAEFHDVVNMTAGELEHWLQTPESKEVGQKTSETAESTGHTSGRHIVALLHRKTSELTDHDIAEMRRVVGYCHRHLAQRPAGDVSETRWRYSLMNWGHDPLKRSGS